MNIAILGATGRIGSRLLAEALRRGHQVTALVRDPAKLAPQAGLTILRGDAHAVEAAASLLAGHEALISSVHFTDLDADTVLRIAQGAAIPRLLVTGGAGSLRVAPGLQLVDSPDFPAAARPEALAGRAFLNRLREQGQLRWSFLSPALMILPGERTGRFRLGRDELLVDAQGQSRISMEDFAVAMLDELEHPQHIGERFTVAY